MTLPSALTLPRNIALTTFHPHRPTFECKREADVVPPIDPQAEVWLQEGLRITGYDRPPAERDFLGAAQLWTQAAQRNHWKAMMNLAGQYGEGNGRVRANPEKAVQIVEQAMLLKVPAAFYAMGMYHYTGLGVLPDASRAYAFWQLAADMGNADAQARIGDALMAAYDNPKERFWANRAIGKRMLECAVSQGNGRAARDLATDVRVVEKDFARSMFLLHDGTRFGCEDCASDLAVLFRRGEVLGGAKDKDRADRYSILGDALYYNRDLRFPNLDKVLPLPPAPLPHWNGDRKTLINAAKGVVPLPPPEPASAASQRSGRAHIPEGYALPEEQQRRPYMRYESTRADLDGFWLPQLLHPCTEEHAAWNSSQVPLRYAGGTATAAHSGVWLARLPAADPRADAFNVWSRQRYVRRGATFPDLHDAAPIEQSELTWYFCGQANEERLGNWSAIRVHESDRYGP